MDFEKSVKMPWKNFKDFAIGSIIGMIPIVNLILTGYLLEVARTSMKRKYVLPEWKQWGKLFIEGILTVVIMMLYQVPAFVICALFLGITGISLLYSGALKMLFAGGVFPSISPAMITAIGFGLLIVCIVHCVLFYIGMAAVMRYSAKREIGAAFAFGEVAKKAFTSQFFTAILLVFAISIAYSIIATLVFGIAGILGSAIARGILMYATGVSSFSLVGRAYAEAK